MTHLRFSYDADDRQFRPAWLMSLLETASVRLEALVWEVDNTDIASLITKNLERQQGLRVLKLNSVQRFDDGSETYRLLGHFCPQLHTMSGPPAAIRALLLHNRGIPYLEFANNELPTVPPICKQKFPDVKYMWGPYFANPSILFDTPNIVLLQIAFLFEDVRHLYMSNYTHIKLAC